MYVCLRLCFIYIYIYSLCICDVYACILPSPRVLSRIPSLSLSLSILPSPSRNVAWPVYDSSKDAVHLDSRLDLSNLFERKDRPHTGIPAYLRDDICRQSREARWKSKSTARGVHARVCKRGKVLLSRAVLNGSTRQKVCRWRPAVDGPWHFSFFFFSLQDIQAILFFWELRFFHIYRLSSLLFFIARFWRRIENIRKKINLILRLKRSSSGI